MHASSVLSATLAALACATACRAELLQPSNLPAGFCEDQIAGDVSLTGMNTLNTDADCTEVLAQADGLDLCVVRYHSLTLASGAQLIVSGSRPLVLSAQTDLTIEGLLDASDAGSGGNGAGLDAIADATGGGGGGFGSNGGDGGGGTAPLDLGGPGGPANGTNALVPLIGGSAGGHGSGVGAAAGGKGGGALQLVACNALLVTNTATVRAVGRGGSGGPTRGIFDPPNGGGGGGSGGALLFEGNTFDLEGVFSANGGGGGGGGGGVAGNGLGLDGADGGDDASQASGGLANQGAGDGGPGGSQLGAPGNGADATDSGAGGGGGGATGRIRLTACTGGSWFIFNFSPLISGVGRRCDLVFANGFED